MTRIITTPEEADTLPIGTAIISHEYKHRDYGYQVVFQKASDGFWFRAHARVVLEAALGATR